MKKLHLNNENEVSYMSGYRKVLGDLFSLVIFLLSAFLQVEITCRGQPVVPNLPLESVRNIWFATTPSAASVHPVKDNGVSENRCRRENHSCSEDYLMVLTYGRHCKPT